MTLAIVQLTDEVASYMTRRLLQLTEPDELVAIPDTWTHEMAEDCDRAVRIVAQARENRLRTTWDVQRYCAKLQPAQSGQNVSQEEAQECRFPPIFAKPFPVLYLPTLITDCHGNALVWYLPGLLSLLIQRYLWANLSLLDRAVMVNHKSANWRVGPMYYRAADEVHSKPGTASMSPGWYEQGRNGERHQLSTSASLREEGCISWVKQTQWVSALAGGVLSLIHPEQYLLGRLSILRMAERPDRVRNPEAMMDALAIWTSPFTGLSVMVNRVTPTHRDVQGRHPWLDILVTHGPYTGCRMEFRSLGVRVEYDSGTMVGVCGKAVPHAVSDCEGERACIAYYMRDNVHEVLGVPAGGWMNAGT